MKKYGGNRHTWLLFSCREVPKRQMVNRTKLIAAFRIRKKREKNRNTVSVKIYVVFGKYHAHIRLDSKFSIFFPAR